MDESLYAQTVMLEIKENMRLVEAVIGHPSHLINEVLDKSDNGNNSDAANRWTHKLVADYINTPLSGKLACKNKCNYCCRQAVSVSSWEARRINSYLKKTQAVVTFIPDADYAKEASDMGLSSFLASREKYVGKACPFLEEGGRCRIYPVRPLECRLLYNVSNTPSLCSDPNGHTPAVNFSDLHQFVLTVNLGKEAFADIRDFFPTIKQRKE